ncbi:MAG: efflux RND transporter periplasmic adaptor subunit [Candidatus Omnitrophota bacterium]
MFNKKFMGAILIVVVILGFAVFDLVGKRHGANGEATKQVIPVLGRIESVISTTGTVLPKNRLEIKPPVNGRVEEVLVREGEQVKTGQTLALMSSTERAALLDAARGKGEDSLAYWEDVYKPIPLISPIGGEVIVAKTQPGQTVTTADAVVVLSDHLIVRAQVDETDIGKIKENGLATITIDAYPDKMIKGEVEHIYYESKTVNNVTIYEADVLPQEVLEFFRSGMNATVDFIQQSPEEWLLIPVQAVHYERGQPWVSVKQKGGLGTIRRNVKLGMSDEKNVQVVSGLNVDDVVLVTSKKFSLPKEDSATNPFMPNRRR